MSRFGAARLTRNEAHAVVHLRERRRGRLARLAGADAKEPRELASVTAKRVVARLNRLQQSDYGLGNISLEGAVAARVVPCLDRLGGLAGCDRHDVDQRRHAGLVLAAANL